MHQSSLSCESSIELLFKLLLILLLLLLLFINLMHRIYNYMPEQTVFPVQSVFTIYGARNAISYDNYYYYYHHHRYHYHH
jgi:hypothetical protein